MKIVIRNLLFLIFWMACLIQAQEILKYAIPDAGTELDLYVAVKVNAAGQLVECSDNDPDVIGIVTAKENDAGTRYYVVSSSDVVSVPLPVSVLAGEKLTTAPNGRLRDASLGEIIVGIALEDGDGNDLTLERIILTLGYASPQNFIANQYAAAQSANFWLCLLYTSPSPRDLSTSRMPSSA